MPTSIGNQHLIMIILDIVCIMSCLLKLYYLFDQNIKGTFKSLLTLKITGSGRYMNLNFRIDQLTFRSVLFSSENQISSKFEILNTEQITTKSKIFWKTIPQNLAKNKSLKMKEKQQAKKFERNMES